MLQRTLKTHGITYLLLSLVASPALAFPQYPPLLPNRAYEYSNETGENRPCITCHNNANGGQGCLDGTNTPGHIPPCFNPFGQAFKDNGKVWDAKLAKADADGDGFTNGQELQDPLGEWVYGISPTLWGNPAYATRPGFPSDSPGFHDDDADHVCWYGLDSNQDGDCNDAGEADSGYDCDDGTSSASSLLSEVCTDSIDNDCDGAPTLTDSECGQVVDNDLDGFCETGKDLNGDLDCTDEGEPSNMATDCDDARNNVYFGAPENCIDQLDNDCNGKVDFADAQCDGNDDDHDGYCPIGRDFNGDYVCDATEIAQSGDTEKDCYDVPLATDPNSSAISPAAAEICTDGLDNNCDAKIDFKDSACVYLADRDGDGFCPQGQDLNGDGNCASAGENNGKSDCDDDNKLRSPAVVEICFDAVDNDCDGDATVADDSCADYRDADQDGYCLAGEDLDHDFQCTSTTQFGKEYGLENTRDCNDASAIARPRNKNAEALDSDFSGCFDGVDTDCDGEPDGADYDCFEYSDKDHDGYCIYGVDGDSDGDGLADSPLDGDCTDPGEHGARDVGHPKDCAENNASISIGAQENCVDGADNNCNGIVDKADPDCRSDVDADGDGFCPLGTDLSKPKDHDCTDAGENKGSDCNDKDSKINSATIENTVALCKNGKDDDCDGTADIADPDCALFLDKDRDGFCKQGRDNNYNGRCLEAGEQSAAKDCDDNNNKVYPGRREDCTDSLDNDCNGRADALDSAVCECSETSECADGSSCTDDACVNKHCAWTDNQTCVDAGAPDAGAMMSMMDSGSAEPAQEDAGTQGKPGEPGGANPDADTKHADAASTKAPDPPGCSAGLLSHRELPWWVLMMGASLLLPLRRRRS